MFPVLFEIPNAWSMPGVFLVVEILLGLGCLLAWLALQLRGKKTVLAATLNTAAVVVGLHLALSLFLGEGRTVTVYSFGVVIILAFLAGAWFMLRQTDKLGLERKKVFDWAFWMLVSGIVGARLLYALLNYGEFTDNKLEVLRIWNGGLVWYGGLIPAALLAIPLLRRYKLPLLPVADIGAAAVMLALGLGRWACFLAGDDYGRVTKSLIGVRFYDPRALVPEALRGMPLHPTQLYMSLNCLWIFFAVEWIRRRSRRAGQAFAWMLLLYAVSRAAWIEPFRGDFVERNPSYARHLAAEVVLDKGADTPAVSLKRGAAVHATNGMTGRLLEDLVLPAGKAFGGAYAISDAPAKASVTGKAYATRVPPAWPIDAVAGLPAGVPQIAPQPARWYGSDLPPPPGFVSTSQWISIFIVLAGAALLYLSRKLGRHET